MTKRSTPGLLDKSIARQAAIDAFGKLAPRKLVRAEQVLPRRWRKEVLEVERRRRVGREQRCADGGDHEDGDDGGGDRGARPSQQAAKDRVRPRRRRHLDGDGRDDVAHVTAFVRRRGSMKPRMTSTTRLVTMKTATASRTSACSTP